MGLYHKYRPKRLDELVGQDDALKVVRSLLKSAWPHFSLFTGPSGVGKTTVARIIRRKLECSKNDFYEINAADANGINDIRKIKARLGQSPGPNSKCKVYLLDECQRLTPDAQGALLKTLEDTPKHVYFIFCTTDPQKILAALKTRAYQIPFKPVRSSAVKGLLRHVVKKEDISTDDDVLDKIVDIADGSPRKALVLLEQIGGLRKKEQLNALEKSDLAAQGFNIAQALIYRKPWGELVDMLEKVEEEPETVRRIILSYASKVMIGKDQRFAQRAYLVAEAFRDNFYDSGKAGLIVACWDVSHQK